MVFQPGQSGNPAGKKKGTKNKNTELRELFFDSAPEIINKAVEMAKAGDKDMIRLCIDRVIPAVKAIEFKGLLGVQEVPKLELVLTQTDLAGEIIDQNTKILAHDEEEEA